MRVEIATRVFSPDDQEAFARLSGDRNPLHMDPVAARRTQAGATVVHGLHTLAWFLDAAAAYAPGQDFAGALKVRFDKFVAVGEEARAVLTQSDGVALRGEVCVGSAVVARIALQFAAPAPCAPLPDAPQVHPGVPLDLALGDMDGRAGMLSPAVSPAELAAAFPHAARALGDTRLSALVSLTFLVGMVCPGLHSIFGGVSLAACAASGPDPRVAFQVTTADPRFRVVKMAVRGGGWAGTVDSFVRHPPTPQPGMADVQAHVRPGEFAGRRALVVGGSRGLGELTAKLIAAGGGHPTITYTTGEADAARVAQDITKSGGACSTLRYDVRAPAEPQLAGLGQVPTSLYYMATPPIFRRKSGVFDRARFDEFLAFYVTGFWALCEALRARGTALAVFYPSSVAVEARPPNMTEYAMAKMAGEILCTDAASELSGLRIVTRRLPRLATDQTATLQQIETGDACETMLASVRDVEATGGPA